MKHSIARRATARGLGVVALVLGLETEAVARTSADAGTDSRESPESVIARARDLARQGRLEAAESLLRRVVLERPADNDARFALAQVLSWQKNWAEAETEYARVLLDHATHGEALLGFADTLKWQGRFTEAELILERAARLPAFEREAWVRRVAIAAEVRDPSATRRAMAKAIAAGEPASSFVAQKSAAWLTEVRLTPRVELFEGPMATLGGVEVAFTQRMARWTLSARTTHATRPSTTTANVGEYNAWHELGLSYRVRPHTSFGVEVGGGLPSHSVYRVAGTLFGEHVVADRLGLRLLYSGRLYPDSQTAHLVHPSVSVLLGLGLSLVGRYWLVISNVPRSVEARAGDGTSVLHSYGGGVGWEAASWARVQVDYTRASQVELDQPTLRLLLLESHIVSLHGDVVFGDVWGLRPRVAWERRESPSGYAVQLGTFELGMYRRW